MSGPFSVESLSPHRVLSTADQNLAEMAQRLEAALRKAVASRGVPSTLYVDNGADFLSPFEAPGGRPSWAGTSHGRTPAEVAAVSGLLAGVGLHPEACTCLDFEEVVRTNRGAQADLRATVGVYQNGPALAGIYAQATWANQKSLRTYYGQPGFDPDGGLLFASLGALGSYDLRRKWALLASVEARRLQGDAARSPLAERR